MNKFLRVFVLFSAILAVSQAYDGDNPLKVSVFYEALCPGSIEFITTQLAPAFKKVAQFVTLELVPFGNAEARNDSGKWEFRCQHGPRECYANKIQSCVINSYKTVDSLSFVNCGMSSRDPSSDRILQKCANISNVPWDFIEKCLSSGKADELLAQNGIKTDEARPPIRYVPWLLFNDSYDPSIAERATEHFLKTVCKLLDYKPKSCNTDDEDTNSISLKSYIINLVAH